MRILLDECVPKPIKGSFLAAGHECSTVPEAGLAGKPNGELLKLAAQSFDVFVTLDKGIPFQQNLAARDNSSVKFHSAHDQTTSLPKTQKMAFSTHLSVHGGFGRPLPAASHSPRVTSHCSPVLTCPLGESAV
jgi:hypothetical protein